MGFKDLAGWLKGGIWTLIIGIFLYVFFIFFGLQAMSCYNPLTIKCKILYVIVKPLQHFFELILNPVKYIPNGSNSPLIIFSYFFIFLFLIGALIGFIISKFKSKKSEQTTI